MEKIAEQGKFYLGHSRRRSGVYATGDSIWLHPNAVVEPTASMPVGSIFRMGAFSYFDGTAHCNLSVGRYCSIAAGVRHLGDAHPTSWITSSPVSYTDDHHGLFQELGIATPPRKCDFDKSQIGITTHIGHDVWIGSDCLLKPGITIGNGAIIGARSLVTSDVPPYAVMGGAPARVRKYRFNDRIIASLLALEWWNLDLGKLDIRWDDVEATIDNIRGRQQADVNCALAIPQVDWTIPLMHTQTLDLHGPG